MKKMYLLILHLSVLDFNHTFFNLKEKNDLFVKYLLVIIEISFKMIFWN